MIAIANPPACRNEGRDCNMGVRSCVPKDARFSRCARSLKLMKRLIFSTVLALAALSAFAQGTFTIRKPTDGSTVREVVNVLIPKNSIPASGYVGFWVNGKFLEAAVPDVVGNDYVYKLDTKGRQIPDGKLTIEAVLYVDFNDAPKVMNRSSVEVNLDNAKSIKVPPGGFKLRYKFPVGQQLRYGVEVRTSQAVLSQAQNQLGGRAAQLPLDNESFDYVVAFEGANKSSDGMQGLLRLQPMPDQGKDHAWLTIRGENERRKYMRNEMAPVYMKVSDTGRELFGSIPFYLPMLGSSSVEQNLDLYAILPLPVLPSKAVKPGEAWQGSFQHGVFDDKGEWHQQSTVSARYPARGVLEGVEWENGIPCAKIRTTIEAGTASIDGKRLAQEGKAFADDKVKLDQVFWFALNRGYIIRSEMTITIERKIEAQPSGGGMGGPGGAGFAGGPPPGQSGAGVAGERTDNFQNRGTRGSPRTGGGGAGQRGQPMRGGEGPENRGPGGFGGGGANRGAAAPTTQWQRFTQQIIMKLES